MVHGWLMSYDGLLIILRCVVIPMTVDSLGPGCGCAVLVAHCVVRLAQVVARRPARRQMWRPSKEERAFDDCPRRGSATRTLGHDDTVSKAAACCGPFLLRFRTCCTTGLRRRGWRTARLAPARGTTAQETAIAAATSPLPLLLPFSTAAFVAVAYWRKAFRQDVRRSVFFVWQCLRDYCGVQNARVPGEDKDPALLAGPRVPRRWRRG